MSLVLFLLGMLGLFIINSKKLANDFKENIAMTVFFKNEANDSVVKAFETQIKVSPFVKSYKYVTKEAAAKEHQKASPRHADKAPPAISDEPRKLPGCRIWKDPLPPTIYSIP